MEDDTNGVSISTRWLKFPEPLPIAFVGKEALCFGKDCHLLFHDLTRGQKVYRACSHAYGDGVQCYAGHRVLPMLAFAEKCLNPRIFLLLYPELEVMCTLKKTRTEDDGSPDGYVRMALNDTDYLVTLSGIPNRVLEVWNWRTREMVVSTTTQLLCPHAHQKLTCNFGSPMIIAQFGVQSNYLILWNFYACHKKSVLQPHVVHIQKNVTICSLVMSPENTLFALDAGGNVYTINEHRLECVFSYSNETRDASFAWWRGGLMISWQSDVVYHLRKIAGKWTEDSNLNGDVTQLQSNGKDLLTAWSPSGNLLLYDAVKNVFSSLNHYICRVENVCILCPSGSHLVTLSSEELHFWDVTDGRRSNSIAMPTHVTAMAASPVKPFLVVALKGGSVVLILAYNVSKARLGLHMSLSHTDIDKFEFSESGRLLVVANLRHGMIFMLKGLPAQCVEVVAYLDYRRHVLDVCAYETEHVYRVYMLVINENGNNFHTTHDLIVKSISKTTSNIKKKTYKMVNHSMNYIGSANDKFYVKIYNTKFWQRIEFKGNKLEIAEEVHSGHMMCGINLSINKNHAITYGYDGLVTVRPLPNMGSDFLIRFAMHHRTEAGIRIAQVEPGGRYAITLGKSGVLACTMFSMALWNSKSLELNVISNIPYELVDNWRITESWHRLSFRMLQTLPEAKNVPRFPDDENLLTYLEMKHQKRLNDENMSFAEEKMLVQNEFCRIKNEVLELLEENLLGPESERIDILEFYMHDAYKHHREALVVAECEWIRTKYRELIARQNDVTSWLREQFWDPMSVKRTSIQAIHSNFSVENYAVRDELVYDSALMENLSAYRVLEKKIQSKDSFEPWVPRTDSSIRLQLMRPPVIDRKHDRTRIHEMLDLEEPLQKFVMSASTACDFIQTNPQLYEQEQLTSFNQIYVQAMLLQDECRRLREYFNENFDKLMEIKDREMSVLHERCDRLRYILSELGLPPSAVAINEPKWTPKERPESFITVTRAEMRTSPWISPEERARIAAEEAEAERLRLLMKQDDFKERALMAMMDGVLEVRWEDTLKRDIPKPQCMLQKDPEDFNEDDLRIIQDYESKVAFLQSSRQRYRNMLETEYAEVTRQVRESVRDFNENLKNLLLLKLKVESASEQDMLRVKRMQFSAVVVNQLIKQVFELRDKIKEHERKNADILQRASEVQDAAAECRASADVLVAKDRLLEKNFRKDLSEYSPLVQEQAAKLYKKHPKSQLRTFMSPSQLVELGKCLVTGDKYRTLSPECLDYLRSVDNLDQYIGVPNIIDEMVYRTICRHRRLRLENELRMRANTCEQTETDSAIGALHKSATSEKTRAAAVEDQMAEVRKKFYLFIHDKQIQLVLNQGIVEMDTTGHLTDYKEAALEARTDIEMINTVIARVGERKLKVMREAMVHRRTIMLREWQHRRMNMEIVDLQNELQVLKTFKVTLEIQDYLRNVSTTERKEQTLEQEISILEEFYGRIVHQRKQAVDDLERQISDFRQRNRRIDRQIAEINVGVCEQRLARDTDFEKHLEQVRRNRMHAARKRAALVRQIQNNHNEMLVLQTELELLRLRTYPTLKFKTLS